MENAYTDVVEEFKYDSCNEQYNMAYLQWRRHADTKIAFRFSDNSLENMYVSGTAAAKQNGGMAEREALMRCGLAVGGALLLFFICEFAGNSLMTGVLRLMGIYIRSDFLQLPKSESQWAVVVGRSIVTLVKYLLPAVFLIRFGKLPRKVFAPVVRSGIPELLAGIGAGMIIAGFYCCIAQRNGVETAQTVFSYENTGAIAAYGVFNMVIVSVLAELFLHGTILTLLRQFGDPFAIIATSVIAFLFPNDIPDRVGELLIGLTAAYLLLRSGSMINCIILRIVYTGLNYARLVAVYTGNTFRLWEYVLLLISLGTLALMCYVMKHRHQLRLSNRKIILTEYQKYMALVQTVTMLPWLAVSVLLAMVQVFY